MSGAYPLSPMQGGMLYQSLLADGSPERAGYDIEQVQISIDEPLDVVLLEKAWNQVVQRYPVLTNRFRWKEVSRPEQSPQPGVQVPFERLNWSKGDINQLRQSFLETDRQRGFNLNVAPLMRVTVASLGDTKYEIFWTFHHILMDGRSFARVLHAIFTAYSAQQPLDLQTESTSFSDYIAWVGNRGYLPSLAFFKQLLIGKQSPTPLPLAEPIGRPLPQSGYGVVHQCLTAHTYQALSTLAECHQTTIGGLLQVAWALVLSRLTGDPDVVYGIVRSCRYFALNGAAESTVGLFINTLPARITINDQRLVGDLLVDSRKQWIAQRNHDQTPLIEVQKQSEFGSGVPLFETLLMYDNRELNQDLRQLDPTWKSRNCVVHEQPSAPLTLIATDGEALELKLLYSRRRYSHDVAERILNYLLSALDSLPRARLVGDVEVLPQHERDQILFAWNDTERCFDKHVLIHELFESRVDTLPDAVAVEVDGRSFCYAEIESRANRLANALRARGAAPGSYVGVCLSRSADLVIALLGIAKSGAAYLPIDAEYPTERIAFMLADTDAKLVVTESAYAGLFAVPTLYLSAEEVINAPSSRPAPMAKATDVCYAIYTSGSTGKPKGVVLTHRAVVNTLEWVSRNFAVQLGDRALFVTSHCFDLSVYDVFGVLGAGGTVVVATSECLREPRDLVRQLVDGRITIWDSAPAALQRLTSLFPVNGGNSLRLVMLSGDWIPLTLPDAVRKTFPAAQVVSLGGATEAAIWSNWYPIGAIDPRWTSIPYGRPIQNSQYYVLDKRHKPVAIGVTGDLYISGACLANGYLNRPELTAERFVANPFRPGERMYMTGDLARYFPDGELEFLGRADFQVKIRGYRVELGEIEAALLAIPGIGDALCSAFEDISVSKALVAYVTLKNTTGLDAAAIKSQLRKTLPDFMVPARVVLLAAMPISANGKVDRNALPAPLETEALTAYVAPRSDTEKRMAGIWRRLLKRDQVGLSDNFFTLGGDSLLAVSLAVEIEQEFEVEFPLVRVMEYPTLKALAASVGRRAEKGKHLVTFNAGGKNPPLVLFCGVGGFGFFFHDLAKQLGSDQPVHVLHAVGADDESESVDNSIEELAAIYEPQILAVCANGPIILGGYSFGALVAYELVRRMERNGRQVPLVISFDGPAPGHPKLLPIVPRMMKHVSDWLDLDSAGRREYLRDRIVNIKQRFKPREADERLTPGNLDPVVEQRLRKVAAGLGRARDNYAPTARINTDLLLLKAGIPFEWPGCRTDEVYGWGDFFSGDIKVATIPGSHLKFFGMESNELMVSAITEQLAQRA